MEYTREDLLEAKRQVDSTLHKLREAIETFGSKENSDRYKSQITLAKRRVRAFEIAVFFIEKEIEGNYGRTKAAIDNDRVNRLDRL